MNKKKIAKTLTGFLIAVFLIIGLSFLLWFFQPKKKLDVFLLNKTVPTRERNEHKSFHWVLNQKRFVKPNGESYKLKENYYGFFPTNPEKQQFDFRSVSIRDIDQISDNSDFAYYADTYGVYYNDWVKDAQVKMESEQKVYGGLNQNDYLLLKNLMDKGKTIITEFVLLNKTTSPLVRKKTEDLLQFSWEGWIGRYFSSLNIKRNPGFPAWIVDLYEQQNQKKWNYKQPGVVLIHKYGRVIVLEASTHLNRDVPIIRTQNGFAKRYQLPSIIQYPYWFDIVEATNNEDVTARFDLSTNARGDSLLADYDLNSAFPAIINHGENYNFYYFAGDFCQNPIYTETSYFSGVQFVDFLFYSDQKDDRARFFWNYYLPLISGILEDTYEKIN